MRAAVTLADGLGIEAVVEGVESPETLEALRSLGVQSTQGYIVSEPENRAVMEHSRRILEALQARLGARSERERAYQGVRPSSRSPRSDSFGSPRLPGIGWPGRRRAQAGGSPSSKFFKRSARRSSSPSWSIARCMA